MFARRPPRPALLVAELGAMGRWTLVFSSLGRLALHAGECDYLSTTGEDFIELVPEGIAVMLDPYDEHRFPVLSRVASPEFVTHMWLRQSVN
ncbi:hypothetical protein B1H26_21870 [Amycolatopsis sp. BJA-103]|nr:hypothetical protein BKN51_12695 [Amycolatopsis sp. BJA-103]PNE17566.1 hypothetical protein B1H26_21870 [Amycolatopsis sp. BJA-103]